MSIEWGLLYLQEAFAENLKSVAAKMSERPYQEVAMQHAYKNGRCVVDGKPGSGKTLVVLTAALKQKPKRILIMCSKNALWTWNKEIQKWYPEFAKYYKINKGTPGVRQTIWSADPTIVACTYSVGQKDLEWILKSHSRHPFDVLIMDEYQKAGLLSWKGQGKDKNGKSKTTLGYRTIDALKSIRSIYPTSGTTAKKGPQHLWPMLNLLNRKLYPSYWQFVNRFCVVVDGPFGKEIVGPQNTLALKAMIASNYHRIPRSETDKYLPPVNRQVIPIDMTSQQAKLYKQIDDEMWHFKSGGEGISMVSTVLAKITKLRQLLVSPRLINPEADEIGAIAETILDMVKERDDHHCVIFTPFRSAVLLFEAYFKAELKTDNVFHVWGGTEPDELRELEKKWKATKGLMIATTLFAQSYELDTSDCCFFAGYECEHTDNEQCEGRLRRITNPRPINAYYLQHRNTYDERWLEILIEKKQSVKLTFQNMEEAKKALKSNG